ncbi:MAG: hypothetical protein IJY81_04840 [Lachnospiraceae bacterium]|nr:hypothetical protein [Lachnospiraceae bacterium]
MITLTYTSVKGRKYLALKRSIMLCIIAFLLTVIFYVVNLIIAIIIYGPDNFSGPIQTIISYSSYTYLHSKGTYLLIVIFKNAFIACSLTMFTYMIINMFNNVKFSIVILAFVMAFEWWLTTIIKNASNLEFLKYINIFNLFKFNEIDRKYYNLIVNGSYVPASKIVLTTTLIIFILGFILSVLFYRRTENKLPKIIGKLLQFIEESTQKLLANMPFIIKELWKIFITKKGLVIIAAGIYVFIFVWNHTLINIPNRYKDMDEIYREYGGKDWSAFEQYIKERESEIDDLYTQATDIQDKIQKGELSKAESFNVTRLSSKAKFLTDILNDHKEKIERRNMIKDKYDIDIYLVTDRGYHEAFGHNSTMREYIYGILIFIVTILLVAITFEIEHESHIMPIHTATLKGRKWIFLKKYSILMVLTFLVYASVYITDILLLIKRYALTHFDAPIQSLDFMMDFKYEISIASYVMIMLLFRLVFTILIQGIVIFIASRNTVSNRSYLFYIMLAASIVFILLVKLGFMAWLITIGFGVALYIMLMIITYKRWMNI